MKMVLSKKKYMYAIYLNLLKEKINIVMSNKLHCVIYQVY